MYLFGTDLETRPVLIAEIGVNHEGDLQKALELLDLAAACGADAVKFQSYTAERFISAEDPERLARVRRFGLTEEAHLQLKHRALEKGIAFFSSAISEDWVPFLADHCAAIKIASGDIDFEPVIRASAEIGKPVILSTGTATLAEVVRAVNWAKDAGGIEWSQNSLAVMHCVSAYPTPLDQANLLAIQTLQEALAPVTIGYSNHVMGPEASIAAVALGAKLVEVHFTDQKEGRDFRDHALSCDPDDLAYLSKILPKIAVARGNGHKVPQDCEKETGPAIRKGLTASVDMPEGHVISESDLHYTRPATQFPSNAMGEVVGKKLIAPVKAGTSLPRMAVGE